MKQQQTYDQKFIVACLQIMVRRARAGDSGNGSPRAAANLYGRIYKNVAHHRLVDLDTIPTPAEIARLYGVSAKVIPFRV